MKIFNLIIVLIGICFSLNGWAQDAYKDPFIPLLPGEPGVTTTVTREGELVPPDITIEGILWGSNRPQAIIDGDVYGMGDDLLTVDAQVIRIEKDGIVISYKGAIHKISVKKREAK
jgi:hypothetical protein